MQTHIKLLLLHEFFEVVNSFQYDLVCGKQSTLISGIILIDRFFLLFVLKERHNGKVVGLEAST